MRNLHVWPVIYKNAPPPQRKGLSWNPDRFCEASQNLGGVRNSIQPHTFSFLSIFQQHACQLTFAAQVKFEGSPKPYTCSKHLWLKRPAAGWRQLELWCLESFVFWFRTRLSRGQDLLCSGHLKFRRYHQDANSYDRLQPRWPQFHFLFCGVSA